MSGDAIKYERCHCGWKRPLLAVTRTDGQLPAESLSVSYACPECGAVHHCGEVPLSIARHSRRARALERGTLERERVTSSPATSVRDGEVHALCEECCLHPSPGADTVFPRDATCFHEPTPGRFVYLCSEHGALSRGDVFTLPSRERTR